MYEILEIVYGSVPVDNEQHELIKKHYNGWPDHLGYLPYNGADEPSGYIGVVGIFDGLWSVHGKKIMESISIPTDEQKEEAKIFCETIRSEVSGCENFPNPDLIFIYSTS